MKVSINTLGCKVNQYESQAMLSSLIGAGFTVCPEGEKSDVVILNTCTVTSISDRKDRQMLRRARRENPSAVIVVTGCMTQANPEIAERLPEADIVLGNSNHFALVPDILRFLSDRKRIVDIAPHREKSGFEPMEVIAFSTGRAHLSKLRTDATVSVPTVSFLMRAEESAPNRWTISGGRLRKSRRTVILKSF